MKIRPQHISLLMTTVIAALVYLIACLRYDGFFSLQIFINLFLGVVPLGLAAIGITFVILSGGIDLSVGSMVGFVGILLYTLTEVHHWHATNAILLCLALGTFLGAFMGMLIQFGGLAPFLTTLAGLFFIRGLGQWISLESGGLNSPVFTWLSDAAIEMKSYLLPLPVIILAIAFIIAALVSLYTRWGRAVFAIGGNEPSATLMGLPVARTKILVYATSGFCSALAGVVYAFSNGSGNSSAGAGMELDAIAAVVIGGTLLSGGVGSILGTVLGLFILSIINTGITTYEHAMNSAWTRIIIGAILFVFIAAQKLLTRLPARQ